MPDKKASDKKSHDKKNKRFLFRLALFSGILILFVAAFLSALATYNAHIRRAEEIDEKREELLRQLHELENRRETLEGMIEYTESEEFLLRYAREYLGYMFEGDIRIDVDNPDKPVATPVLPLVTAVPTDTPDPSYMPSGQPTEEPTSNPSQTTVPGDE